MNILEFSRYNTYFDTIKKGWVDGPTLQEYEIEFLKTLQDNKFTLSVKSRQMNFSSLICLHIAYFLVFNSNEIFNIGLVVSKHDAGVHMLTKIAKILEYYNKLNDVKVPIIYNKKSINYDKNKLIIIYGINGLCSFDYDSVIFDEMAWIKDAKEKYEGLVVATQKVHLISSVNSKHNLFNDLLISDKNTLLKKNSYHYSLNKKRYTDAVISGLKDIYPTKIWDSEMEMIGPKKNEKANKERLIQFRVTDDIYSQIGSKLIETGLNLSDYIRSLVVRDLT